MRAVVPASGTLTVAKPSAETVARVGTAPGAAGKVAVTPPYRKRHHPAKPDGSVSVTPKLRKLVRKVDADEANVQLRRAGFPPCP